jgi:hypothetical protein
VSSVTRTTLNGVAIGFGGDPVTAYVSVSGIIGNTWSSTNSDAVALVRAVVAGECGGEILAEYLDEVADSSTCAERAASLLRMQVVAPKLHVRTWTGSGTASVIDMTNAGKRGKTCRMIRFSGWVNFGAADSPEGRVSQFSSQVIHWLNGISLHADFDEIHAELFAKVAAFKADGNALASSVHVYDETIRGVDAPKVELLAGVGGLWSASADENGVHIRDLADVNEWTEITSSQSTAQAYKLAAKVWPKVQAAKTRRDASEILRAAGCRLHGFCGMD